MREVISIATVFLLLAAAGIEPGPAHAAKSCKAGAVVEFFSVGC